MTLAGNIFALVIVLGLLAWVMTKHDPNHPQPPRFAI